MRVTLVDSMGSIKRMADIASVCYGREEAKYPERLFKKLIDLGHTSVLEHYVFTFKIENISRACLAQLTRHRHASYTVESQRYVKYGDGFDYIIPIDLEEELKQVGVPEQERYAIDFYITFMDEAYHTYQTLLDKGVKPEDARMVLPNAVNTNLYMTINLRSLMNLFKLRMDKAAQWEIRELAFAMFDVINEEKLKEILKDYLPVENRG